ncbi:protein kinase domain containing protein, putative [Babesia bigemina]|uniref:Protein kinase domain containing protein, putative n=1 Tax=Babesia bigemina TaxID=5866 RepID=A0A061DDE5_BABBI|nr:protein kinase domain containing protein, putative [Babesia bigemina]CDR97319.1 protein kinase domain containing protein, putative [Babesia bigemina]|eukprot:XP_012769505.1 protein kinase domain containing protein, putative [Babesia bigemina]
MHMPRRRAPPFADGDGVKTPKHVRRPALSHSTASRSAISRSSVSSAAVSHSTVSRSSVSSAAINRSAISHSAINRSATSRSAISRSTASRSSVSSTAASSAAKASGRGESIPKQPSSCVDSKAGDVYGVSPQRQEGSQRTPLVFVNIHDKRELFVVPPDYPYKYSSAVAEGSVDDMVYPLLPKMVRTPRRTLVPFCGLGDYRGDSSIVSPLDTQLSQMVKRAIDNNDRDLLAVSPGKDSILSQVSLALPHLTPSQEHVKRRRHSLFAKQWKRNAINDCLYNFYASRFKGRDDATVKENVIASAAGNETAQRLIESALARKRHAPSEPKNAMTRNWISSGPVYCKSLSDVLKTYYEYLYSKQEGNGVLKRKVAATSRYFFEILAEAKDCERKMRERELVTEERLYGRKDFIADIERENQNNRNRCKKMYTMYLQCQKRCEEMSRHLRDRVAQQAAAMGPGPSPAPVPVPVPERVQPPPVRPGPHSAASHDITEDTAMNAAHVPQQQYDLEDCKTTAPASGPATGEGDREVGQMSQTAERLTQAESNVCHEIVLSLPALPTQEDLGTQSRNGGSASAGTATPSRHDFSCDTPNRDKTVISGQMGSSSAWDVATSAQNRSIQLVSSCIPSSRVRPRETLTPTKRLGDRSVTDSIANCSKSPSSAMAAGSRQGGPITPSFRCNSNSAREQDTPFANRLSSVGHVNKRIYSKMEEKGELEGYRALLSELNALLFADGGSVLGFSKLPPALSWLDETDNCRPTVPPSQENFRDGTLYTTCSYAEIKLMKVLQGGICALRSKNRSKDMEAAILQQIIDVNSELLELKKKLDNGRCALYKKLKRDWAERNSKWAGFPPLKRGYRLLNMLGKGGFAEVWEVLDPITLTVQAAKLHILSVDMNPVERGNVVMRVKNEIDIHKTCRSHKNIVNMKACFEMGDNMLATILELCDDGDLDHYIKLHAPVPEKLALTWTYQILEGLHYMKTLPEGRVHHCDLKPGNILKHRGDVKLADFGLSKMVPHHSTRELWGGGGTIFYQPPECLLANFRNKQIVLTDKIDIWAVGCILYEMLYNARPFGFIGGRRSLSGTQQHMQKLLYCITERMYQAILSGVKFPPNDRVSEDCRDLISRFLAFEPNMRPSIEEAMSAPVFHAELSGCI